MIIRNCKRRKTGVGVAGIDYKIAYDMFPHSWLRTCIDMFGVAENTRNTWTQQPLAHTPKKSLENPSNNDKFSKFSKRQILLTITGRGHAIKKNPHRI